MADRARPAKRGRSGGAPGPWDGDPLLSDLMPWSVPALRTGRDWVRSPDPETLRARWRRLIGAAGEERAALFRPSRSRTLRSAVAQLPGRAASTVRLAREAGPCPEPEPVRHGAFDRQWLLPDHRLLDAARPELWRVADGGQLFAVVQERPGPALVFGAELPDGHRSPGRGPVRPLYRRPGAAEPNLAPGLTDLLAARFGCAVAAGDVAAWTAAVACHPAAPEAPGRAGAGAVVVPLPDDPGLWRRGTALGREVVWLSTFGERCTDPADGRPAGRPRMPGGRRPFVRRPVPDTPAGFPAALAYDAEEEALLLGDGRIAPVPASAWEYRVGGERVLETWFAGRAAPRPGADAPAHGSLEAVRPASWPRTWTTELTDLATVLALLAGLHGAQAELVRDLAAAPRLGAAALRAAGVLPAPDWAARPASVLAHLEEGPEGQFALL
ncbi:type ISP restriction/modification enzyme [Streptacidiphilus sp. ASG 303]|uniref:type ISP restriction/modification enzyme n=1 Tax=Streptacidiphilus sp. ASG 303 TaxID=2896847 RepID=UPI0035ADB554